MNPDHNPNHEDHLYSLTIVENLTNIPVPTLRKYISRFRDFITVHRLQRGQVHLDRDGLDKVVKIRLWIGERKSTKAIKSLLKTECGQVKEFDESTKPQSESSSEMVKVEGDINRNGQADHQIQLQMQTLTTLIKELNQDLTLLRESNEDLKEKNLRLADEVLLLKEYKEASRLDSSKQTKKMWSMEQSIQDLQKGQGLWETMKRWMGLS